MSDDGNDADATSIVPDGSGGFDVLLRAERAGNGGGRTYPISTTATDLVGNIVTATASCVVPHDQGKDN